MLGRCRGGAFSPRTGPSHRYSSLSLGGSQDALPVVSRLLGDLLAEDKHIRA